MRRMDDLRLVALHLLAAVHFKIPALWVPVGSLKRMRPRVVSVPV